MLGCRVHVRTAGIAAHCTAVTPAHSVEGTTHSSDRQNDNCAKVFFYELQGNYVVGDITVFLVNKIKY